MNDSSTDPRMKAFCDPDAPEVFHAVAHHHEIWKEDPFDVEEIHAEAREVFQRCLNRVSGDSKSNYGYILLMLGNSGSGKTHLMRAFCRYTHSMKLGFFCYMQLGSYCSNYSRYILSKLIDSLNQTYLETQMPVTGLMMLSNHLAESKCLQNKKIKINGNIISMTQALRELDLPLEKYQRLITHMTETLLQQTPFQAIDMDLLSAFLYLQTGNHAVKNVTLKYLRGENLSDTQRAMLGGIVPKCLEHEAARMIEQIGLLMYTCRGMAMVICLDQLEDMYNLGNANNLFPRAMSSIRELIDSVPSSLVVISCLEDYYTEIKKFLSMPIIDRLENDPMPVALKNTCTVPEIKQLIQSRLQYLYETMEVDTSAFQDRYFPFQEAEIAQWNNFRARDVIHRCHEIRNRMMKNEVPGEKVDPKLLVDFEQRWNDFLVTCSLDIPEDSEALTRILSRAIELVSPELDVEATINANPSKTRIDVNGYTEAIHVGLCNKKAQGGGLQKEIEQLNKFTDGRVLVIARCSDFPASPSAKISRYIGELIANGARRVVMEDSDWRSMLAFQSFMDEHGDNPGFKEWRKTERPLSRLQSIQKILNIANPTYTRKKEVTAPLSPPASQPAATTAHSLPKHEPTAHPDAVCAGQSKGRFGGPITFQIDEFKRHAAFLGGSGSGKTTLALQLIEQLLLKKIPAVMIDRKGDLASYADSKAWHTPVENESARQARERLQAAVHVRLYTPGDPRGNPLSFSLLPKDSHRLSRIDREQLAAYSANSLARMMDYGERNRNHKQQTVILQCAISLLSEMITDREVSLQDVIALIDEEDPLLINRTERLDSRLFEKLVQDLTTLQLNKHRLFADEGARLDIGSLLGRTEPVQLSIISTKFLGDPQDIDFWVARFLIELGRWISQNPSNQLQAVVLFDEADIYLPATRKPSTKEPMENLLKRARAGGIGIFLSTQSPGDLDYRCRDNISTWFLGRIKEDTALKKLRPMLSEQQADIESKLPGQSPGEFYVIRDHKVEALQAQRSLIQADQMPEDQILMTAQSTHAR